MIHYILLFLSTFVFIFLRAFQQRNVAFDHYAWIIPTSFAMATVEVYIVAMVAHNGWGVPIVGVMGFGGGTGALAAALFHKRYIGRKKG